MLSVRPSDPALRYWCAATPWLQFAGLMGEEGVRQLSDVFPLLSERLSPQFLGDHFVALCAFLSIHLIARLLDLVAAGDTRLWCTRVMRFDT